MPKCTIDGKQIEVAPGTTVIQAAEQLGIRIPRFCWHPDLTVDGNCRICLVEIEKMPKLQIACNTQVTDGMVVQTSSPKAKEAQRTTLEFLLINHPIDCPVCDQAGECYLQDQYMTHGLYGSQVELEDKVHKRKVVDLGPIMLDAERCVLCSRCIRFEREVTGTNLFEFVDRGDHTQIATFENRPITHEYAGNLADVCPVGALLSRDFRFKMRVWFLKPHESICPGCSTGCNVWIDERDSEVHRLRPRRNPDVNKSWICDPGRASYREIGLATRVSGARVRGAGTWDGLPLAEGARPRRLGAAGGRPGERLRRDATGDERGPLRLQVPGRRRGREARLPRGRPAAERCAPGATGSSSTRTATRTRRAASTRRSAATASRRSSRRAGRGTFESLVLQGPELLRVPDAAEAIAQVPFVVVMATHEGPELDRVHAVLPAAVWAEVDGTFTNYQRRVQRLRAAVVAPGDARPLWRARGVAPRAAGQAARGRRSAREVFALVAAATPDYGGLDSVHVGHNGHAGNNGRSAVHRYDMPRPARRLVRDENMVAILSSCRRCRDEAQALSGPPLRSRQSGQPEPGGASNNRRWV